MKKIVILAADGYEDIELWYPKLRFIEEGFQVIVAAKEEKEILSKHGYPVSPDIKTSELKSEYDAVIIPGGIKGAENLRMDRNVINFIRDMYENNKVIASICHGAWVLISAFIVKGKNLTCYEGMKDDLIAAGAKYEDKEVIVDKNLITSRKPADLPAFTKEILKKL